MPQDIIPRDEGGHREWLQNLINEIDAEGPKFGLAPGSILPVKDWAQSMLDAYEDETAAESALAAARTARINRRTEIDKALRDVISGWKEMVGFTPEIGQKLRVISSKPVFDADNHKPKFKIRIVGGEIRIDWTKSGLDGVYIYGRLPGSPTWTRIGMDTSSPYIDGRPLAQAGVPETREYKLRGMIDDKEVGLDSDVQSITWGGQ